MTAAPYKLKFKPIVLKDLVLDCGIIQADLARHVAKTAGRSCSRATINIALNRGWLPTETPEFKKIIETIVKDNEKAVEWLRNHHMKIADIWQVSGMKRKKRPMPRWFGSRVQDGWAKRVRPMIPGDPESGECTEVKEMFSLKARKSFKIFQSPFSNNFDPEKDAFLSEDHRFIRMAMKEAAEESGMIAVIGEVGSGKTAMRKMFVHDLKQDPKMRLIFPRIVDKRKISDNSICDAIILDLAGAEAKCKNRPEQKARQVEGLITKHAKDGIRLALVVEEAQDLVECPRVLKLFKRFNEIEVNGKKTLAIILIGQPELAQLLDENVHFEMREVIRRMQVAEIAGLNGSLKSYLQFKFDRVNMKLSTFMTEGAIDALGKRLTIKDKGQEISTAHPLTVNNYVIRAINWAAAHGEEKVTEEVVNAIL